MAEIVNLRRARKAKGRAEKDRAADANRTRYGTAKSERDLVKARTEKEKNRTDAHLLDRKD